MLGRSNKILRAGVRAFSDASNAHAPPKKIHGTVGRYAGAIYTAASKAKSLDKVEAELNAVVNTMKTSAAFDSFIKSPTLARDAKASQLAGLLDEKHFSVLTRNAFLTLAANGRLSDIEKVVGAYTDLMEASRGAIKVVVTSAEALPKKKQETITSAVMSMVGKNAKVTMEMKQDPSILGGLQVLIGDKFMDLSVNSRVQSLSQTLNSSEA